jgi:hypothetical protein
MPINRDRIRKAFVDLGAARPEQEAPGLTDELLVQLVELKVEDLESTLTMSPQLSARLRRAAQDFSALARRTLVHWGRQNNAAFSLGEDSDDLYRDDGAHVVLQILRAPSDVEAMVVADSSWRDHFRDSTSARYLKRLVHALRTSRPLLSYCGVGHPGFPAGKLEDAVHADAKAAWQAEEIEIEIPDADSDDEDEDDEDDDEPEVRRPPSRSVADAEDEADDDGGEEDEEDEDEEDEEEPRRSSARASKKKPSAYISPSAARYRRR